MRPTLPSATRLILLTLATGLFVVAWSGDRHGPPLASMACRSYPLMPARIARNPETLHRSSSQRRHGSTTQPVSLETAPPMDLAPGVYQFVDETGRCGRVAVPDRGEDTLPARDLYVRDDAAGIRGYYIRIRAEHVQHAATLGQPGSQR